MTTRPRCPWPGKDPDYRAYHDTEWGVPVRDDRHLFEMLCLEGAQAGLSWITILKKRPAYRALFFNFDPEAMARMTPAQIAACLSNPGIVRNRLKVNAFVSNARAWLDVMASGRRFSDLIWSYVDGQPVTHHFQTPAEVPDQTPVSKQMSNDLKKLGFCFVGPTICYAYMQSVGLVNDHLTCCFRHAELTAATASPAPDKTSLYQD